MSLPDKYYKLPDSLESQIPIYDSLENKDNYKEKKAKDNVLTFLTKSKSDTTDRVLYNEDNIEKVELEEINEKIVKPNYSWSKINIPQSNFVSLQKWEGYVTKINNDTFNARLVNLTTDGPEEEVGLPINEVSKDDLDLLVEGAVFYWNIGYYDHISGQRTRSSIIRFRRLPMWRESDLEKAVSDAEELKKSIKWD